MVTEEKGKSIDLHKIAAYIKKNIVRFIHSPLFKKEWFWALLFALFCSTMTLSNLLWTAGDQILQTDDMMGHMAKITYIADCLKHGQIPSWFGGWYNGTAATQYYVPLSYYVTVPLYWIFKKPLLTYKVLCILVLTIGGMGVYKICRERIGAYVGFFGIAAYCLQHVLTQSLFERGVIAQAPIIAAMPWYLYSVYNCMEKPNKKNFFGATFTTCVLIFSHAMHAYLVCGVTMAVGLLFVLMRRFSWKNYGMCVVSLVLSGIISACWSVVGVLGLEDYNEPYLQQSGIDKFTASADWFFGSTESTPLVFSTVLLAWSFLVLILLIRRFHKREKVSVFVMFTMVLMLVSLVLSFGKKIPGYKLIPLASSLVPGRILTYTAVMTAILFAYLIKLLLDRRKKVTYLIAIVVIGITVCMMNPFAQSWEISQDENLKGLSVNTQERYDKGRFLGSMSSTVLWNATQKNLNLSDGWNIEGTVHNWASWLKNIALKTGKNDYILKQLEYWNVEYYMVENGNDALGADLEAHGFVPELSGDIYTLYHDTKASGYYYTDPRNILVIGSTTNAIAVQYPNMVKDNRDELLMYSIEELERYDCIYLMEQNITTRSQKEEMEAYISQLVADGVTVWVEPMMNSRFQLFDVTATWAERDKVPNKAELVVTEECPYALEKGTLFGSYTKDGCLALYNLDETYLALEQKNGSVSNAIVGTKKVDGGEVLFLGGTFSQLIDVVYAEYNGYEAIDGMVMEQSKAVDKFYQSMFDYYELETDWEPTPFSASVFHENYRGGNFYYQSRQNKTVTVSITYSPRWKIYLDGEEIPVHQRENLITLDLPAGRHMVSLEYGMTKYGKFGYLVTFIGLFLWLFLQVFFERIPGMHFSAGKIDVNKQFMQLPQRKNAPKRKKRVKGEKKKTSKDSKTIAGEGTLEPETSSETSMKAHGEGEQSKDAPSEEVQGEVTCGEDISGEHVKPKPKEKIEITIDEFRF